MEIEARAVALPWWSRILYTANGIGSQAISQTISLWLLFFLAPPPGQGQAAVPDLSLGFFTLDSRVFVGILLTSGRLLDAFDDPIIGWWSDRTRSRWGRRIPFILFSAPFYAFFFALLWVLPADRPHMANAVYIFLLVELFYLASTFAGGPYEALFPEVVRTHRDRMNMVVMEFYFAVLGAGLGLVLSGIIKDVFDFRVLGAIMAVLGLTFRYLGLWGIWKHAPRNTPPSTDGFITAWRSTMRNKQFLCFLPTFVFFQVSAGLVLAWLPFLVATIVSPQGNGGGTTSLLTAATLAAMLPSVLILWRLGRVRGKKWVYSVCLLGSAVYLPLLFFTGFIPGVPPLIQAMVMAFFAGIPLAGVFLLPKAITADITDYDELCTGVRREGMFYATQNLFEKTAASFSPLLLSLLLLLGDSAMNPTGIRLVGPLAGAFAFLGFWMFRNYRLPSTVTRETVRAAGLPL